MTLLERIERLETECEGLRSQARRWKRIGGIALIPGLLLVAVAAARPNSDVPRQIEAREFRASSSDGKSWARFGLGREDTPFLSLQAARSSLHAGISKSGHTVVSFSYQDPRDPMPLRRLQLTMTGDGEAFIGKEGDDGRWTHVPANRPDEPTAP